MRPFLLSSLVRIFDKYKILNIKYKRRPSFRILSAVLVKSFLKKLYSLSRFAT